MADFVVGASIQTNTYNLVNAGVTSSTTVPFSGINSYDFTGVTPGSNASYVPNFGRVCWGLNDFTLECFIRGNGTDDPEGTVFYIPLNAGLADTNFGRNLLVRILSSGEIKITNSAAKPGSGIANFTTRKNSGAATPLDPSTWYHLAIIRKDNKVSILFDGEVLVQDIDSSGDYTSALYSTSRTTDFSGLGLMFIPFGGLNNSYSKQVADTILGSISGGSFKNFDGFIANFRSSYIAQYDVTQTSYTVPSAAFTGAESGTDYYVKTFSGTGNNNSGTALPRGGINELVINELVLENTALGSVTTVEENNQFALVELNTNLTSAFLGNVNSRTDLETSVTGLGMTSSVGNVGAGLGILVPVTQPTTANVSLGDVEIPILWSKVQTGTTTNWTEIDTG